MPNENVQTRNSVPFIHVRGTHYEIGFEIGRTFRSMIQSYVSLHGPLNSLYLPAWETAVGKKAYESTLAVVMENYPQYVEEMRGTAEGAQVPFHKIFLLHMDEILPCAMENKEWDSAMGCSTICCNFSDEVFLAHNEDALQETMNHFYFVSADIQEKEPVGKWKVKDEKFTSLCYAGTLPGFTMSYNKHGLVYSVNVIRVKDMQVGKTPRSILCRALLAAQNVTEAENILRDPGTGIGDGININLMFLKEQTEKIFYNIEAGPSKFPEKDSLIDVLKIGQGKMIYHCNKFLRLKCPEDEGILLIGSKHREAALHSLPIPKKPLDACHNLGDTSDDEYPVFRNQNKKNKTIVIGLFDLNKLTWAVYADNPKTTKPILELPISF